MLHDLHSGPISNGTKPKRRRFNFGGGNGDATDGHKVGLLPSKGWRERNFRFLNDVLIPHLLAPRQPRGASALLGDLEAHQTGVTWLGHAGFLLQMGGKNILIDPVWALWLGPLKRFSHPSLVARDLPYIDLVLITHAHFDHLHLPSLRAVAAGQPIIVPQGVGSVVKTCAFSRVIEMDYWQSLRVEGLDVTFTPMRHWGARFIHDTYRKFGGYVISDRRQTVFHSGDSSLFDGYQEIAKRAAIDVALMPIGAYAPPSGRPVHMSPEEALQAFEMVGAKQMVPMHYGTFPISGEPLHEPEQRLLKATRQFKLQERVHVLSEGQPAVF
jgi:L-ascorbate metabolism protein UlaG (beta-lactamase superfamily)